MPDKQYTLTEEQAKGLFESIYPPS